MIKTIVLPTIGVLLASCAAVPPDGQEARVPPVYGERPAEQVAPVNDEAMAESLLFGPWNFDRNSGITIKRRGEDHAKSP